MNVQYGYLTLGYFQNYPLEASMFWLNSVYLPVNLYKRFNAKKSDDRPRLAFYDQLWKGNLFLLFFVCSRPELNSESGSVLWLTVGLWYVLTPWRRRANVMRAIGAVEVAGTRSTQFSWQDAIPISAVLPKVTTLPKAIVEDRQVSKMPNKLRPISVVAVIVASLLLLFPPFKYPRHDFAGFHCVLSLKAANGGYGAVDTSYLFIEMALVLVVTYIIVKANP